MHFSFSIALFLHLIANPDTVINSLLGAEKKSKSKGWHKL